MRKIFTLFIVLFMLLALAACSGDKEATPTGESIQATTTPEANTTPTEETQSTTPPTTESSLDNSTVINLDKYVSVQFEGKDLAGRASVTFDKEQFLLDNIGNISFNQENLQVYHELYGNTGKSAAYTIMQYISVHLSKITKLSNGDTVETVWMFDTEVIETYFVWEYTCSSQHFTVEGLKEAGTFDPFEEINVTFSGIAPYGEANVYNRMIELYYGGSFEISPCSNLKNGDQVTVTYTCDDKATMIAKHGVYPASYEKTYTVSGLNTYVQSIEEISDSDFDRLISDAVDKIWVTGYGNYRDAKYCGNYFYTAKNQPAHGVYFLQWCGFPVGNAVCFVFEYPSEFESQSDSGTAYLVIALENLLIDENGSLVYSKHEMWQIDEIYTSQEALNKAFIGVFDEIMHCANNVEFN